MLSFNKLRVAFCTFELIVSVSIESAAVGVSSEVPSYHVESTYNGFRDS